ncbi:MULTISPECIES: SpoIIE family protein phosphatase [Streptomyces]|uniref:SpoIIE family protein phosphatase n=1 Tax=Streptomyces TaxID=1883 RepID=UPI00351E4CBE
MEPPGRADVGRGSDRYPGTERRPHDHTATYTSAGRTPPVLLGPDGVTTFLDKATDPPLGARSTRRGRTQGRMRRRDTS